MPDRPKIQAFMHPKVFAFWLLLISSVMFFAALTSAYIVKNALNENPFTYRLPQFFAYNTLLILLSSGTMLRSTWAAKRGAPYRLWLIATLGLGILFLGGQWQAWRELVQTGIFLVGHPIGSFVYVLSGAHALHLIIALLWISYLIPKAKHPYPKRALLTGATFWHFLSILWIYLYLFLIVNTT